MTEAIVVLTTTSSQDEATKIAQALVERQLAACVQIAGPITSIYRWQGKIENSHEWLCIIKSLQSSYATLEAAIRELHSYEVPEIIALPVLNGSADYLSWLTSLLSSPK